MTFGYQPSAPKVPLALEDIPYERLQSLNKFAVSCQYSKRGVKDHLPRTAKWTLEDAPVLTHSRCGPHKITCPVFYPITTPDWFTAEIKSKANGTCAFGRATYLWGLEVYREKLVEGPRGRDTQITMEDENTTPIMSSLSATLASVSGFSADCNGPTSSPKRMLRQY